MMKITFDEPLLGHDHRAVRVDGRVIGFQGLGKDEICLAWCPKCRRENYCLAVSSGKCEWCGLNINEVSTQE